MIDLHAHVVLENSLGACGQYGPELYEGDPETGDLPSFRVGDYVLYGVKYRDSPFMDLDLRLEALDALGIDLQVLSPNPLTYFSGVDASSATLFAQIHNDALAELVAQAPDRLAGFAQLPTQDPSRAVTELHRAVNELSLLGAYIGTDLGRPLDHPEFDQLYEACVALNVPLFLHPAPDGVSAPRRDERLARFDGDLWLGFCYEETLAVSTLILGGVMNRHPDLDICISHGGGASSWLAERLEHAARTRPWSSEDLREPGAVAALLQRFWWDSHVGGPKALASLIATFGLTRVVAGTNLAGWDQTTDPSFAQPGLADIFDQNARRLLRLNS
ncbi:MAG: amidohydrolase family protein [Microthrixaceae bacterium]